MLKETKNKGVVISSLLGLFFLLLSIFYGIIAFQDRGVENLVRQAKILTDTPISSEDRLAAQLVYVSEEILAETKGGSNIYLAMYQYGKDQYGYIGLEATSDDKEVQALIKKGGELENKPVWIEVKPILVNSDEAIEGYSDYMREVFAEDPELASQFDTFRYVSRVGLSSDTLWEYGGILLFAGLGIFLIGSAVFARRRNVRAYKDLYAAYPEVEGNLNLLLEEAAYRHDKIGILVYKDHIFSYRKSVAAVDIRDISQIYHSVINHKRYFITVSRTSTLEVVRKEAKKLSIPIKNIGKQTNEELEDFFAYLDAHYPDIAIGYSS